MIRQGAEGIISKFIVIGGSLMTDPRDGAFLTRLRANRLASTLMILATLTVGILIGTVISYGVKGQEGKKSSSSDATPLSVPSPQVLSNQFSQIAKQLEPS